MESQRKNYNINNNAGNNSFTSASSSGSSNHRRGAGPSVGYLLFQYQSELTRRHAEPTRLSRTKIHIIDGLVSRTIRHLKHCSVEELQACKRELVYKEQLRRELRSMPRRKSIAPAITKGGGGGGSGSTSRLTTSSISSSTLDTRSTSAATKPPSVKLAPATPPKPRRFDFKNVSVYGPEIFV